MQHFEVGKKYRSLASFQSYEREWTCVKRTEHYAYFRGHTYCTIKRKINNDGTREFVRVSTNILTYETIAAR